MPTPMAVIPILPRKSTKFPTQLMADTLSMFDAIIFSAIHADLQKFVPLIAAIIKKSNYFLTKMFLVIELIIV